MKAQLILTSGVLLLALHLFHGLLPPERILFTTDDGVARIAERKAGLPEELWTCIGTTEVKYPSWTNLLIWLLPLRFFVNWIHALDLGLASLLLAGFLRRRGCSWAATAFGAGVACWVGVNFTLVLAGHTGKFGVFMFACAVLYCLERGSWPGARAGWWTLAAGAAFAAMFLEQPDVALFYALFLGPYALLRLPRWSMRGAVAGIAAAGLAWAALTGGVANAKQREAAVPQGMSRWEYATQWSLPPEDLPELAVMGYCGWHILDPEHPYKGRMGRGGGIRSFRLESYYLGPFALLLALYGAWRAWKCREGDGWYWSIVAALALALSLGRWGSVYWVVFHLPALGLVRNPNKFMHVFQLSAALLAAYGLNALPGRRWKWALVVVLVIEATVLAQHYVYAMPMRVLTMGGAG